jgi:hypothetical protein
MTHSRWMRAARLHEPTLAEGLAVARARRAYADKARLPSGLSAPASEQMRGYADPPAGRRPGVDIGSPSC